MARHLPLLDATQRRAFDQPPVFNQPQRQLFFALPDWATQFLTTLLAPHSRGGFVLQVGYFKSTGRFFPADRFLAADQAYVQQRYHLEEVEWVRYDKATRFYHREHILQQFGVLSFEQAETAVRQQVTHFARQQMNPVAVFHSAANYIRTHRWEVPTYAALAGLVTEAFRTVEQDLTTQLAHHLIPAARQQLDALFTTPEEAPAHSHRPCRLTTLKRSLELMRPMAIRANVQDYAVLQALFTQVYPVVQALALSEEIVRYYARYVERTQVFQVQQQADKKHLMVLCFVVNLGYSLRYRPFDTYLLDAASWERQREGLLVQTDLTHLREPGPWLAELQAKLATAFARTCERLDAGTNPGVRPRANGRPRFLTPARPVQEEAPATRPLFPGPGLISLHEVLHTVNQECHFTDCLTHWSPRNRPPRPAERVFFAGLMAHGCNLGLTRMAHTTKHVALATLENTVNWYFSLDNLRRANDAVVALTGKLPVSRLFKRHPEAVHTSSDGQKYYVAVDSIHATYSYKYFGQEKGIVSYGFLDDRHRLFYSTTFSSSEREAPYLVDGLLHNDVVESTIHSTDTHGFTEVNFALTAFIAVEFAPRIQSFQDQQLYAFAGMDVPELSAYGLAPVKYIDRALIEAQWDTLLRLVVSLKQKHVTASTLLRRLNSYSQQHPVYLALRELGRVVRTEFLLRYMDDQSLRKRIDGQLDKLESTHTFARAVFYGQNGQISYAGKDEQQLADACKRLVQNTIVCWNCLYLNQYVFQAPATERQAVADAIAASSPVSWQHINLHGDFDFSDDALKDSLRFDIEALLAFNWEQTPNPPV